MAQELTVVRSNPIEPTKEDYMGMAVGEPNNMLEARAVAAYLSKSKFLPASLRGDTATALMLVITCKQYNLPLTALSEVMEVNGKIGFWGRTKLGIVLKSGLCEYIIPEEQTEKKCTLATLRKGWPKPVSVTYTIEQAEKAGLIQRSDAWKKHPADMLYWRAVTRIISQVYPDVIQGFATVEEAMDNDSPQIQQAQAVIMPEEMPKAKKAKKVKAITEETSDVKIEEPIIDEPIEVKEENVVEEPNEQLVEGDALFKEETPVKQEQTVSPKRYLRFIKQVFLEGGERYITAANPLTNTEDKWIIPSASMAGELKKLTGAKVFLLVENNKIISYEECA